MEEQKDRCYCCRFFERYYTKGETNFQATKVGWCWKKQMCIEAKETCEKYETKPKRSNKINGMMKRRINDFMTELTAIRQILEENKSENV